MPTLPDGARYYAAFWPGAWYALKDGARDSIPTFVVRPGPNPAAFEEEWRLGDGAQRARSVGLRAWDQASSKGSFLWVSDQGHAQVWDAVKVGEAWYIQRPFDQGGQKFLSRQTWIPSADGSTVDWLSERSLDEGKTWAVRYRLTFVRGPMPAAR
ncbi:MAG TPA: hypothetical protein VM076_01545 [Gemmatimonadaceae bacterium]|nr:hypothetical protein [Gemmatimonadaceae bacterium]